MPRVLLMPNKSLLALSAALLSVALAGCDKAEDGTDGSVGVYSLFDPVAANPSLCGGAAIPFPNNALFSGTTDATLNIPNPSAAPFVTAANLTDGFSTSASIFTDVLGAVDFGTANDSILIFEADASPRFLAAGTDFTVQPSIAMAQVSGTGPAAGACAATSFPARFQPISQQRSRLLIEPLKPLNPSTTYIVAVTRALKSRDGVAATENEFFRIVNSDTKLCDLTGAESDVGLLDCTDPNAPAAAAAALGEPVLAALGLAPPTTAVQKLTTLETLRRSLVRPTVTALKGAHQSIKGSALNDSDLVIAWSFTTQSTSSSLASLNTTPVAVPRALGVAATNVNTNQANAALASYANIYAGTISLPYFLANASSPTAPLTTFWAPDTGAPVAVNPPALGGAVPCGALAPPSSTTICYPRPVLKTDETVPVMVTVPNASAPGNCGGRGTVAGSFSSATCVAPAGGWPVVIFQHGITRNRSDMLALAPTLAAAGFVTVAIDLPLHGLVPAGSAATCGSTSTNAFVTDAERTFGLDLVSNTTGAPGADGIVDCSGTHFVNLSSLITSRDNLRQAASDLIHLAKSVNVLNFDGDTGTDEIAETQLRFAGQSLGAIVGTLFLGVNTDVAAASLHVPGGALGKLLDASASFGPRIAAGLAASFVYEGTDTYETFVRFAQHVTDPGDPINYAAAANTNHAIHLVEVIADAVVPNSAGSTCPEADALPPLTVSASTIDAAGTAAASGAAGAALLALCPPLTLPAAAPLAALTYQDETVITGFLSGTDPLIRVMGLTNSKAMGSAPFAAQTAAGADTAVVFAPETAEHGTLLSPDSSRVAGADATFAAATCAMQKQTATFLASNGALLPIGGTCP